MVGTVWVTVREGRSAVNDATKVTIVAIVLLVSSFTPAAPYIFGLAFALYGAWILFHVGDFIWQDLLLRWEIARWSPPKTPTVHTGQVKVFAAEADDTAAQVTKILEGVTTSLRKPGP